VIVPDGLGGWPTPLPPRRSPCVFAMFPRDATRRRDPIKYLCTCVYEKTDEGFNMETHIPSSRKWGGGALLSFYASAVSVLYSQSISFCLQETFNSTMTHTYNKVL
jgi:hypothetical protein